MLLRFVIFLLLNFLALGIGGWFTGPGVNSVWYVTLEKAPWTPPGWVFGFAWGTIMNCFSLYLALLWTQEINRKSLIRLYILQWILNVLWNPLFFYFHQTEASLFELVSLSGVVAYFLFHYRREMGWKSFLLLPYFIWLLIATSLNAFSVFMN